MTPITDQELEARLRRGASRTSLRPEVHARMRASIVAEFQRVTNSPAGRYKEQPHGSLHFIIQLFTRPMIPAIIAIVLIISTAGTAVAADRAKPGDALYGVDRGLEVAKFAVVFGDDAKTKYLQELAEERGRELGELEEEGDTEHADEAHQNALDALERVRIRLENNQASDRAREEIEERVDQLRNRLDLEEEPGDAAGLTEAEATVHAQITTLQYEFNDRKSTITLQTTNVDAIVTALADLLNIDEAAVRAVLRVEVTGDNSGRGSDDQGEDDNVNGNVNGSGDEDEPQGLTEAEAKIRGGTTTVQLEFNDQKSVLTLQTTDVNAIVQAIASNLGVDEATVRAVLRIEYEDEDESDQERDNRGNDNSNENTNSAEDEREDEDRSDDSGRSNANRSDDEDQNG
ncbi:MAG: hypothetical protein HY341_02450, partial [Candidatus Kerfeldbacteria bacterium]|nr:hypothetical protein [Candidatus Kerfeldbacteria bacterium]